MFFVILLGFHSARMRFFLLVFVLFLIRSSRVRSRSARIHSARIRSLSARFQSARFCTIMRLSESLPTQL